MKYIYYIFFLILCSGCGKFLDDYSQDLVIPKTVADLNEVLLGSAYLPTMEVKDLKNGGLAWWLHILDDDINTVTEAIAVRSVDMDEHYYGYTTWQLEVGRNYSGLNVREDNGTWDELYKRINAINIILSEIDDMKQDSEKDKQLALHIKGESHFLRAQFYLTLVNIYADMYSPSTASSTLGVPLKLTHFVEHDKDKKAQFERMPVADVYQQIVNDLKLSIEFFDKSSQKIRLYRASKEASILLLSRVYLYMQDWPNAQKTAEELLAINNTLLNYAVVGAEASIISESNPEILFSQSSLNLQNAFSGRSGDFCISNDLYSTYEDADLRKDLFFGKATVSDSVAMSRKYKRGTHKSLVSDLFMLRVSEAYLNLAEAYAMQDNVGQASSVLNRFRSFRISNYMDVTLNSANAIDEIRSERRKELCMEGHRWFDLRRYAVCEKLPFNKTIERRFSVYDWDDKNTLRSIEVYTLKEKDLAYTFAIPNSVIEFDMGMPNNKRETRMPSELIEINND